MNETPRVPVTVTVTGYELTSPSSHEDDWREQLVDAAAEIASDVGMELASLGLSCFGGKVIVECDGVTGESD